MIEEGAEAPDFELSAIVDGAIDRVSLGDYLGESVVVLVFYPGDFTPACDDGTAGLAELDLFTMQKDVAIIGVSSDTVYSHAAFAEDSDIHFPLASDLEGSLAEAYGVRADADTHLVERAVAVIDLDGEVSYAWHGQGGAGGPPIDEIRAAVDAVSSQQTATARYGVGHAHYVEGRRCFTSATTAYEEREWLTAQGDFERATTEFDVAAEEFNTAARFAAAEDVAAYFERAEDKARSLWQAAEWLGESAEAYTDGRGAEAMSRRESAASPLESASAIPDPVDPESFDPASHGIGAGEDTDEEAAAATGFEFDVAPEAEAAEGAMEARGGSAAEIDSVDEADLEEIAAEIQEQSERVTPQEESAAADPPAAEADENGQGGGAGGEIDLELTDPSGGEDELVDPEREAPEAESEESEPAADVN